MENYMDLKFPAISENESFARLAVAAFIMGLDPYMNELADIKTAVSEAVTNAIIHGYDGKEGEIELKCSVRGKELYIEISDEGVGIKDVKRAMEPMFTSKPEGERTGLGFTIMESFMDRVEVISTEGEGTTVKMNKTINKSL